MEMFSRKRAGQRALPPELVDEASINPGGWVYEIDGEMVDDPNRDVPPEAIIGAWQVNALGKIYGDFQPNPNYRPGAEGP